MSQIVTLQLDDQTYDALRREADLAGASIPELAAALLERQFATPLGNEALAVPERISARQRFESHFGAVDLGHPLSTDNDAIDADLAREFIQRA